MWKYSKGERYPIILDIIKSADYYLECGGSYEQIAYYTNECIELLYGYNKENPILDLWGAKIYFGYDERTFKRDGLLIAQIKGAVHLITQKDKSSEKRYLDTSRSKNLSLIQETLLLPDYRLKIFNPKGELTYNYILNKNSSFYVVVTTIEGGNFGRVITFLPRNSKGSIIKKNTSAIETEVKSSTEQTPSI